MQMNKEQYLESEIKVFDVIEVSVNGRPPIKYIVNHILAIYDDLIDIEMKLWELEQEKEKSFVSDIQPTVRD